MGFDKPSHCAGAHRQIIHVVNAFAGPAEKAQRTLFRNIASRRDDNRLGKKL